MKLGTIQPISSAELKEVEAIIEGRGAIPWALGHRLLETMLAAMAHGLVLSNRVDELEQLTAAQAEVLANASPTMEKP